jgi:hypothetical protein
VSAREKLETYDAWLRELERRQEALQKERSFYQRSFLALPFISALGYAVSVWIGAAALFTGLIMCVFGFYVVVGRAREYEREILLTRRAADELRAHVARSSGASS